MTNKAPASSLDWAHLARQSDADTAASLAVAQADPCGCDLKPGSRLKETDLVAAMNVIRHWQGYVPTGFWNWIQMALRVRLGWQKNCAKHLAARLAATNRGMPSVESVLSAMPKPH